MLGPRGRKTILIGLDGVPWSALEPMLTRGHMPNVAALAARGASSTCVSPVCPMSPIAWSSIATGKNPGKHGIYDWTRRKPDSYALEMVSSVHQRGPTVWDLVSQAGLSAGVFNVPVTYPPRPVSGFMVTCMLTPSNRVTFTHPAELSPQVNEVTGGYEFATRVVITPGNERPFIDSVLETLVKREKALDFLLDRHDIDFGLLVYTESDAIQHKLWPPEGFAAGDPPWPSSGVTEIYRRLDAAVGRLVERFGRQANLIILSDHGAGEARGVMYVNRWLMNLGRLRLNRSWAYPLKWFLARTDLLVRGYWLASRLGLGWVGRFVPKSIQREVATNFVSFADVDWSRTRAYSVGEFGQIYLNLKGREPQGIVEPGAEAEAVLADLARQLGELKHPATGRPLITRIWRRNEAFHGPAADEGADLLFAIDDYAYEASVQFGIGSRSILGEPEFKDRGCHRPGGILIAAGPDIARSGRIGDTTIMDIAPTALHLLGLPVPEDMDGRVIQEMLAGDAAARPVVRAASSAAPAPSAETTAPAMTADEQREVEERLRNLGYLD